MEQYMEANMIGEAFKFMALGMGIVFTFLVIMIFTLKAQAAIIAKYFTKEVKKSSTSNEREQKSTSIKNVVAAVTAAILHHNQKN
jgi:oxaloacetate decarboxylase gamma subunit